MRLHPEQIQKISKMVLKKIKGSGYVTFKVSEEKIFEKIVGVITKNMFEESKLDEEAQKKMDQARSQIKSGDLDEHRAFQMIKKQLAKEKKFVL
ncbi:MAG: hypothetical protein A3G32_02335 [Deltaproteobacteria bacterium RIFCSPLOWO2_12_FULL_40_28]|nr:MAG: hypothetical protein A3C45_03015 [Deltaproteobacteria bacterium RIFCSPHIGHO2_02_FULL_40_28]OGQ20665.1 MAG: hypothetical protein A3E27_10125 [Deltaproteobacteria bacterium RIFCSPHIGHO2_12_FULL_40_32]OGQ38900.1 MAG: hypothetical protein A3I69_08345 [Deltaproteobacteria bacterium RIFCSPLOWO2_02_FULL_40_36]OGQ55260.1 MAG: hypothetical protein A3G32_02335 [Deltaproteobacteria bacterium RIFCSPLOWO2_12_FULL_40_28]